MHQTSVHVYKDAGEAKAMRKILKFVLMARIFS